MEMHGTQCTCRVRGGQGGGVAQAGERKYQRPPGEGTKAAEATGKWTCGLMQEERSREPGASRPQEHGAPQDAGWVSPENKGEVLFDFS